MSVVVVGDVQAVAVAGYVAAVSGRRVHLVRPGAPAVREVILEGRVYAVDVVAGEEPPAGPVEALVVVGQSRHLLEHLEPWASRLGGVPVLLAPGGFAGALRARAWFAQRGLEEPLVAEATGFPAGGALDGGRLTVRGVKRSLPMAGLDADRTAAAHAALAPLLPELVASELTTTSLSNTNHMIHPGVVLVNASRVDNAEPFSFYRSGISPAVSNLLAAVDRERVALVDALGGEAQGVTGWMSQFYGAEGMAGRDVVECLLSFGPFAEVAGPSQLDYRYLVDDVPFGLAQWSALARAVGVDVPQIDALLTVLRSLAPDLPLDADEQAALLFHDFLASHQGVPA